MLKSKIMEEYYECNNCGVEQPVENFQSMDSGEVKRKCNSCRNGQRGVIRRLKLENPYPYPGDSIGFPNWFYENKKHRYFDAPNYKCPICEKTMQELVKRKQKRLGVWVLDHCHETETFRGWICHLCNMSMGGLKDNPNKLLRAFKYLENHKVKQTKFDRYTKEDIKDLEEQLIEEVKLKKECDKRNDHKLQYSNRHRREVERIKKLIHLIQYCDLVEDYNDGLVLIDEKFVVSLSDNNWRIAGKSKWYRHKNDIDHFIYNYIYKDVKHEANARH